MEANEKVIKKLRKTKEKREINKFWFNGIVEEILNPFQYVKKGVSGVIQRIVVYNMYSNEGERCVLSLPSNFDMVKVKKLMDRKAYARFLFHVVVVKNERGIRNILFCECILPAHKCNRYLRQNVERGASLVRSTTHKVDDEGYAFPYNY